MMNYLHHSPGSRLLQGLSSQLGRTGRVGATNKRLFSNHHASTSRITPERQKFLQPSIINPSAAHLTSISINHLMSISAARQFSQDTGPKLTEAQIKRAIGDISEKFTEAMELMNDARSSVGTVYFSEDVEDTQAQVAETLGDYKDLLSQLDQQQRKGVIQSVGLKMEELKAQMSLLEELAKE